MDALLSAAAIPEPLGAHCAFASGDLASFRRYLSQSYCEHHVRARGGEGATNARHNRIALTEISLNYLTYGADVEIDIGTFDSFFMLEVPLAGQVRLDLGKKQLTTNRQCAAIISPTLPVFSNWSADCAQIMVKIDRCALERHLCGLIGRSLPYDLLFEPGVDLETDEARALMQFCWFMFDQYARPAPSLAHRLVSRDVEHAFMSALLLSQPNNYSDMLRVRATPVAPRHIRKALRFIDDNLQEPIEFDALVSVSEVSARALYAGFNKFVGMPPQTYIKNLRLDRAREELAASGGRETVAEIALRWQFNHLGRFSSEYRRRFGESPRETLRR